MDSLQLDRLAARLASHDGSARQGLDLLSALRVEVPFQEHFRQAASSSEAMLASSMPVPAPPAAEADSSNSNDEPTHDDDSAITKETAAETMTATAVDESATHTAESADFSGDIPAHATAPAAKQVTNVDVADEAAEHTISEATTSDGEDQPQRPTAPFESSQKVMQTSSAEQQPAAEAKLTTPTPTEPAANSAQPESVVRSAMEQATANTGELQPNAEVLAASSGKKQPQGTRPATAEGEIAEPAIEETLAADDEQAATDGDEAQERTGRRTSSRQRTAAQREVAPQQAAAQTRNAASVMTSRAAEATNTAATTSTTAATDAAPETVASPLATMTTMATAASAAAATVRITAEVATGNAVGNQINSTDTVDAVTTTKTTDTASTKSATRTEEASGGQTLDRVRLVQRVARAVESAQLRGGTIRMRIHPPELGSLRIDVEVRDGNLTARIEAETSAAKSALLENLPVLRDRLAEQNIRVERFEVHLQGEAGEADTRDFGEQRPGSEWASGSPPPERGNRRTTTTTEQSTTNSSVVAVQAGIDDGQLNVVI